MRRRAACAAIGVALALVLGSAAQVERRLRDLARESGSRQARDVQVYYQVLRKFYGEHVLTKVLERSHFRTAVDHGTDTGVLPLAPTILNEIEPLVREQGARTSVKLYSSHPFAGRRGRSLDSFQREAVAVIEGGAREIVRIEERADGPLLRVGLPDRMITEACVNCHNMRPDSPRHDWQVGQVRGVLEVSRPLLEPRAGATSLAREMAGVALGAAGLAAAIACLCWRERAASAGGRGPEVPRRNV